MGSYPLINILHILPNLLHGGAEHQLAENVAHLDPTRFRSYVCLLNREDYFSDKIRASGASVFGVHRSGRLGWIKRLRQVTKLIKQLDIDIVHGSNVPGEMYAGLAGKLTGRAVVSTITNIAYGPVWLQDNPNLNKWKLKVVGTARKLMLRNTHHQIIAISNYVKTSAIEGFGINPDVVSLIYRGLPTIDNPPSAQSVNLVRDELDLRDCPFAVLNIGRLVPQKGQRYLIEAFVGVVKEIPAARLLVVGEGFLELTLKTRAIELGIQRSVQFLGRRDDVPVLLKVADVFAFPSLFEGLGVTLLEASKAGAACIASDIGPIPEIVTHDETGLLVESGNVQALTDALLRLAQDSQLRERLGARAQKRIAAKFTIEKSIQQLGDLYETMVPSKKIS